MKTAIIAGAGGQDGRLLFELLSSKGYRILGISRNSIRTRELAWQDPVDITQKGSTAEVIRRLQPDEIYLLAAFHHSSQDQHEQGLDFFRKSYEINVFSLLNFLEAARVFSPKSRIFYASSSLVFGETQTEVQTEKSPFSPNTVYGQTKADGIWACRFYRQTHGVFVSAGILFNHESALRREEFLSRKIIQGALDIKRGKRSELLLGSLSAQVDWGYAPEYVEAFHRVLNIPEPGDFIIATGRKHSVQDFVEAAFDCVALDWKKHVREQGGQLTRKRTPLVGDASLIESKTGWKAKVGLKEMIRLILADLDR